MIAPPSHLDTSPKPKHHLNTQPVAIRAKIDLALIHAVQFVMNIHLQVIDKIARATAMEKLSKEERAGLIRSCVKNMVTAYNSACKLVWEFFTDGPLGS